MRALLMEWMKRNDGKKNFYSDARYNRYVDTGVTWQIQKRRTWKRVKYWESAPRLGFAKPLKVKDRDYRWNEYLYVGRSSPGKLVLSSISIKGPHAKYLKLSKKKAVIAQNGYVRIKVAFRSRAEVWKWWSHGLQAYLEIRNNANGIRRIQLVGTGD